jgi:hypothetical protein
MVHTPLIRIRELIQGNQNLDSILHRADWSYRLQSTFQYTAVQTTSVYRRERKTTPIHPPESLDTSRMSSTGPLFPAEEKRFLREQRKRYLRMDFMLTGASLDSEADDTREEEDATGATLSTDEEKVTQTTTITAQQSNSISYGVTFYATALTCQSGVWIDLPLFEDTGSGPNWLPRQWVNKLQCELRDLEPNYVFTGIGSEVLVAKHRVEVSLGDKENRVEKIEFYVYPEQSSHELAIIGRDYLQTFGRLHERFDDKPRRLHEGVVNQPSRVPERIADKSRMVGIIVQAQTSVGSTTFSGEEIC